MKKLIAIAALLALAGCSDPQGAQQTLEDAGYKDIHTTGYAFFGCSDNDAWRTGFEAMSPGGHRVYGVVCSSGFFGLGKADTIRIKGRS